MLLICYLPSYNNFKQLKKVLIRPHKLVHFVKIVLIYFTNNLQLLNISILCLCIGV
nr:MAG TPA: hypothetical protein [Caudoviricetes sp.]